MAQINCTPSADSLATPKLALFADIIALLGDLDALCVAGLIECIHDGDVQRFRPRSLPTEERL